MPEVEYSPAVPLRSFDVAGRLKELQQALDDDTLAAGQKENIMLVIKMYQDGELPKRIGELIYVQDGKVCKGLPDFQKGTPLWTEVFLTQSANFMINFTYEVLYSKGVGMQLMQAPVQAQQFHHRVTYDLGNLMTGHEILAVMRLPTRPGGDDDDMIRMGLLNDTGSTLQTIFDTDLASIIYNPQTYQGHYGQVNVMTANGIVARQGIVVEMQLRNPNWEPASDWFVENGVIVPFAPNITRLSGSGLRSSLYFATAPGNQFLYVARKKNGVVSQLPVI